MEFKSYKNPRFGYKSGKDISSSKVINFASWQPEVKESLEKISYPIDVVLRKTKIPSNLRGIDNV